MSTLRKRAEDLLARLALIGADPRDDDETRLRKALLVLMAIAVLPISIVWAVLYLSLGGATWWVALLYAVVSIASLLVFARTRNFDTLLRVQLTAILLAPTVSMIPIGGILPSGAVGIWGMLAPLAALIFMDVRAGIRWYIAFVIAFLGSGVAAVVVDFESPFPVWFSTLMLALNVVVGVTIVFTLLALFAKQRRDALAQLKTEQAKAENLLLNILPASIAQRLKAQAQPIADQFAQASILFADVVDFTPFSENLSAAEVVGVLDRLFTHFDTLVERYDLEKIKTIGDAYMVAAGIPRPRPDHAQALAQMALDMLDAMRSREDIAPLGLELRVGINSGPVVAGVIGRKRFLYDLWGDAVNTASRMESHGTPGHIQITGATYELVKDEFVCEPRGPVSVKGKGEMETWYLIGRRADQRAQDLRIPEFLSNA